MEVNNRDDFNQKTKDTLGKRVGYICSNPTCKKHTIGPNSDPEKSTSIGIAAHITAASQKGPRFDDKLTEIERKHISNGIWLCSSCSDLIDKDEKEFPVELLKAWKEQAEAEMLLKIKGATFISIKPNVDIDLIWTSGARWNRGYSNKNEYENLKDEDACVLKTNPPIIHWNISWNLRLSIFNNSSLPIFNLSIETIGERQFDYLSTIPKVNNLPALKNIDLEAKCTEFIESNYIEADKLMAERIPSVIDGLIIQVTYFDEQNQKFIDKFAINQMAIKKL